MTQKPNDRQDSCGQPPSSTHEQSVQASPRQRAEEHGDAMDRPAFQAWTPEETERLLDELRIYRIELAMQNEELCRTREALEVSRARFFDLYDLAPLGYLELTETGLILEANRAAASLLEATRDSLVGQPLSSFILPEDQDSYYRCHGQLWTGSERQSCELRLRHADTGFRWIRLETSRRPMAKGETPGCLAILSDMTEQKKQEQDLLRSRTKLRALAAYREKVREDERAHIARELHDDLGQYLTALRLDANLIEMLFAKENAELTKRVEGMKQLIDRVIAVTRSAISRLRPMVLDFGILSAAEWLVADYRKRTGTLCHLDMLDPELELNNDQATTVFRILQESLTNVARHAQATCVDIRMRSAGGLLYLNVHDDGRGFDPAVVRNKNAFGLMGIRERLIIYGGTLKIDSQPEQGTTLEIVLPIKSGQAS
ncbi:PAS domain-containing sensor histidine kinase [Thiocystis violascens]|uniref:PAS domain S-box n=1 Tax=Thiocystis violascens (strain ATCC 17096 / DSM 198 / 6111) TaxID=765911 RepID=I3YG09_THIV6|nr:histidine kinase [Thiocystis violascens]AFL75927.1 PAS domain S-box [Thiocystis violascens DSM 198]